MQNQCGCIENKSITDHLFTIQALLDYNMCINNDTLIILVNAETCFDKLWLEDACSELSEICHPVAAIQLLREMNQRDIATNETTLESTIRIILKTL